MIIQCTQCLAMLIILFINRETISDILYMPDVYDLCTGIASSDCSALLNTKHLAVAEM